MMSLMPAPRPQSTPKTPPTEPCLESFRLGSTGTNPLETADPIMAAMGSYFAKREAQRRAKLEKMVAEARARLKKD